MNRVILLNNRPHGKPSLDDFKITSEEVRAVKDGLLITGQNPGSSEAVAKLLLKTLKGN